MSVRSLIIVSTLALSSVVLAKSYDITIIATVKAGDVELKPGQYKLKIENGQAVFTDSHDKSVTVPAKVENAERSSIVRASKPPVTTGPTQSRRLISGIPIPV